MADWMRRGIASAIVGASMAVMLPAEAIAATCSALRSELASAGSRRTDRAKAERYGSAKRKQATQLAITKRMAAQQGCRRSRTSQCRTLNSTIGQMENRMAELDRQRRRALGSGGRSRASIQSDMRRKGCGAKTAAKKAPSNKPAAKPAVRVATPVNPVAPAVGQYRTVCVRTCDGYFFPIRTGVSRDGFAADTKQCRSMCPRAETRLFAHRSDADPATMLDRTGKRYADMSYAYRHTRADYRHTTACSCGRPVAPIRQTELRGTAQQSVPSPLGIAPPAGDAETRRNAALGFGWRDARAMARPAEDSAARTVRVVGPAFLPDPAREEADRAPAPDRAR